MKDVLIVDHNPVDLALTMRALRETKIVEHATIVKNGTGVLTQMRDVDAGIPDRAQLPQLIILELELPDIDGFEVLCRLRDDRRTREIPVLVLTTSQDDDAMVKSLAIGADRYLRKPANCFEYAAVVCDAVHALSRKRPE